MNKKINKQIWNEIDEILWKYWDPIGVNDYPEARDEYQSYIGGLYKLITSKADGEKIKNYLKKIVKEEMEIQSSEKKLKKTIEKLLEIQTKNINS